MENKNSLDVPAELTEKLEKAKQSLKFEGSLADFMDWFCFTEYPTKVEGLARRVLFGETLAYSLLTELGQHRKLTKEESESLREFERQHPLLIGQSGEHIN